MNKNLRSFLDHKVAYYERPSFIKDDPIVVPHGFSKRQDIEIAAFFAATFAWGNRISIINSCSKLLRLMDHAPYDFIVNHREKDLKPFQGFVHRTFNDVDLFHFIDFLTYHYKMEKQLSLETAFTKKFLQKEKNIESALIHFYHYFFDEKIFQHLSGRTKKHVATPERKSACKRLNMFLRWMVRSHKMGVDFGIWKSISPQQLICPLDLHVGRVARKFELLKRPSNDWQAAVELTENLKKFDAQDPVKYDYALFALGVAEKF